MGKGQEQEKEANRMDRGVPDCPSGKGGQLLRKETGYGEGAGRRSKPIGTKWWGWFTAMNEGGNQQWEKKKDVKK